MIMMTTRHHQDLVMTQHNTPLRSAHLQGSWFASQVPGALQALRDKTDADIK